MNHYTLEEAQTMMLDCSIVSPYTLEKFLDQFRLTTINRAYFGEVTRNSVVFYVYLFQSENFTISLESSNTYSSFDCFSSTSTNYKFEPIKHSTFFTNVTKKYKGENIYAITSYSGVRFPIKQRIIDVRFWRCTFDLSDKLSNPVLTI